MKTLRAMRRTWSEKQEQRACINLYRVVGGTVYGLSQPRATMQAGGLPDLLVFLPQPPRGKPQRLVQVWHEVKRVGGRLSPAQQVFMGHCMAAGQRHVVGGLTEARALLVELGLVVGPT